MKRRVKKKMKKSKKKTRRIATEGRESTKKIAI